MSVEPQSLDDRPFAPGRPSALAAAWRLLRQAPPSALFGLVVIAIYAVFAILAPLLAPYGESVVVGNQYEPWGSPYLLGTDQLGRDMLSRACAPLSTPRPACRKTRPTRR